MVKKFIVTDPCYIMEDTDYKNRGIREGWDRFETATPIQSRYKGIQGEEITIHTILGTGGDGSGEYGDDIVGVDSGMLCIAENEKGWYKEFHGIKCETIGEARKALYTILTQFWE